MMMNLIMICLVLVVFLIKLSEGQLRVGFYSQTCPNAESIVQSVVNEARVSEPRIAPILLRLHFHDCFVEGCDGSILVDIGPDSEKNAFGHLGVLGFDEINQAKQQIEAECPGVVSCADIVALAARDAIVLSDGPFYEVETGRRDGRVSNKSLADEMPEVNDSIQTLKSRFREKGFTDQELVVLSGAHTIGTVACFFMPKRLYHFNGTNGPDPQINRGLLPALRERCPENGDVNVRLFTDSVTSDVFDKQIMRNIKRGFAVIATDARLNNDFSTRRAVNFYAVAGLRFARDFAAAMVKMGRLGVLTGSQGEIRTNCEAFN